MQVNIALLKAKLSEYLKKVQEGREVIILDRKYPIAKLHPIASESSDGIEISSPKKAAALGSFKFPRVKISGETQSLDLLLEDRKKR